MRLSDGLCGILIKQRLSAGVEYGLVAVVIGLSAAVYAAAGACHDLDGVVVVGVARLYLFHDGSCVCKAGGDSDIKGYAVYGDLGYLYAVVYVAYVFEFYIA